MDRLIAGEILKTSAHINGYSGGRRGNTTEVVKYTRETVSKLKHIGTHDSHVREQFEWGYVGIAPMELSMSILYDITQNIVISRNPPTYEKFTQDIVSKLDNKLWDLDRETVITWIENNAMYNDLDYYNLGYSGIEYKEALNTFLSHQLKYRDVRPWNFYVSTTNKEDKVKVEFSNLLNIGVSAQYLKEYARFEEAYWEGYKDKRKQDQNKTTSF